MFKNGYRERESNKSMFRKMRERERERERESVSVKGS